MLKVLYALIIIALLVIIFSAANWLADQEVERRSLGLKVTPVRELYIAQSTKASCIDLESGEVVTCFEVKRNKFKKGIRNESRKGAFSIMTIDEIKTAMHRGQRNIDGAIVDIEQLWNFRWRAKVSYNGVNTIIDTPDITDGEGIVTFIDRAAYRLKDILNNEI